MTKKMWRRITVSMFFLLALLMPSVCGCSAPSGADPAQASATTFVPLAHPTGTLLEDERHRFWIVMDWPDRSSVSPSEMERARLTADDAVLMRNVEEACLRDNGRSWRGRDNRFTLYRVGTAYWYVDVNRGVRYEATPDVMRAWRDRPEDAFPWNFSRTIFDSERALGPLPLPDGLFLKIDDHFYLFSVGRFHAFASEEVAREAGYRSDRAFNLPRDALDLYGGLGESLTADTFRVCPLAASRVRTGADQDHDGVTDATDCDDHDYERAPGRAERCDNIDNDCDGEIDEDFSIDRSCVMNDGCGAHGFISCDPSGSTASCHTNDPSCEDDPQ